MDPRLEQSPPGAPETLTGSASQEGSRRLLRSQPRRLGFGHLTRRDPDEAMRTYHEGRKPTPKTGTFYLARNRNFLFGSDSRNGHGSVGECAGYGTSAEAGCDVPEELASVIEIDRIAV